MLLILPSDSWWQYLSNSDAPKMVLAPYLYLPYSDWLLPVCWKTYLTFLHFYQQSRRGPFPFVLSFKNLKQESY